MPQSQMKTADEFAQRCYHRGRHDGLDEGRRVGWAEGVVEGRLRALRTVLLRQVERRFGPLPAAEQRRIATADRYALEAWLDRVPTASSLADTLLHGRA